MPRSSRRPFEDTLDERKVEVIEVLELCDSPDEVLERLRKIVKRHVEKGCKKFVVSVDVKVYKPPRGVNKMVFKAIVNEFVQGASLF